MRKTLYKLRDYIKRIIYIFFNLFSIDNNKIIADNFCGKGYGDNPAAIIDEILNQRNDLKIYWALKKSNFNASLPKGVNKVKFGSIKHIFLLATSKIWIDNVRNPFCIKKRKKQFYIQTWHGGFGFKRIEKDVEETLSKAYIKSSIIDSKNMDVLLSNSTWYTDYFSKCFYYDGVILETGLPRNDILFKKKDFSSIKKRVYNDLGLSKEKVLLYAPTFRDDRNTTCYDIDYNRLIDNLERVTKSKWKILIRLHPNIADYDVYDKKNRNIINVSNYSSLNDLMISSDMLISDYSSLTFEYAYLSKPIILYATDVEKYSKERGFLFDIKKLPFPLTTNNDELEKCIKKLSQIDYKKEVTAFFEKYGLCDDGKASKRIVKIILEKISE